MTQEQLNTIKFHWLGRVDYVDVLHKMREARQAVLEGAPSHILAVEHPPVFTVGRRGGDKEIMNRGTIPVVPVERGGKVTYHGPGQSVLYPIFHLERLKLGVNTYVRHLEESAIQLCEKFDIQAGRDKENPGVWIGDSKIAAIGVHVSHSVTIHGMALNVDTDLDAFNRFIPCGLPFHGVARLVDYLGAECPSVQDVALSLAENLCALLSHKVVIDS